MDVVSTTNRFVRKVLEVIVHKKNLVITLRIRTNKRYCDVENSKADMDDL